MMGYGYLGGNWGWFLMIFWWLVIIFAIALAIKWAIGSMRGVSRGEKSPMEILKERYAKGEIDKKDFEEMRKDLEK